MFSSDRAAELLVAAQEQGRLVAGAQERLTALVAELWSVRAQEELAEGSSRARAGEFAVTEAAVALCASRNAAGELLVLGLALRERLPAVRRAWAAGELDLARVRVLVDRTQEVAIEHLALVEALVLERARTTPAGRLGRLVDRTVGRIEPDAVRRRRERATDERRVCITPGVDGTAEIWGRVPAVDGRLLDERLDALARAVCTDDPRSHDARRADALISLAAGTALRCACGCDAAVCDTTALKVQLIVTGTMLAGVDDEPAHLVGHGPVDAETARRLAADSDRITCDVDPATGALVGRTAATPARYVPSGALARLVRLRDDTCRFPGCGVPARRCDLDHRRPFDHADPPRGGPTTADNLFSLCRFHHRAKTLGVWTYEHLGGAVLEWTSPTGDRHRTTAIDHTPLDRTGRRSPAP